MSIRGFKNEHTYAKKLKQQSVGRFFALAVTVALAFERLFRGGLKNEHTSNLPVFGGI